MSNVVENLVPYATYRWAEYKAMKANEEIKRNTGEKAPENHASSVEKQFLTPKYEASIGSDFEDGLFDGMLHPPPSSLSSTIRKIAFHIVRLPNHKHYTKIEQNHKQFTYLPVQRRN